jgi:hypothetical protein
MRITPRYILISSPVSYESANSQFDRGLMNKFLDMRALLR